MPIDEADAEATVTLALARLAVETPIEALPAGAFAAAKQLTLDSLACAVAAVDQPGCRGVADWAVQTGGRSEATLLGYGGRVPLAQAAFVDSVLTHALDYDDIFSQASLHVSSFLFPCCLATGEASKRSGAETLAAYILGAEVACLLGLASVSRRSGPGFLPTTIEGGFGGVAAVCRLMGLSVRETAMAMGLYYVQASGNRQALVDRTLAKRMQPAFAARNAVWAAELAARDVTGPAQALEGEYGLFRTYYHRDPPPAELLARAPGDPWRIEQISVKPYTSCGASHSLIDAALRLADRRAIDPDEVDRVELSWGATGKNGMVGRPFRLEPDPQVEAQFSAPYCVALALLRKTQDLARFTDEAIRADPEVVAFSRKIGGADRDPPPPTLPTPDCFPDWYGQPHRVRVVFRDGTEISEERAPVQTRAPEANDWAQTMRKWRSCAAFSGIVSRSACESIVDAVAHLDEAERLDDLLKLLPAAGVTRD